GRRSSAEADLARDGACRRGVVAGDHDRADAGLAAGTDGLGDPLPYGILEGEEPGQPEAAIGLAAGPRRLVDPAPGPGDHLVTLGGGRAGPRAPRRPFGRRPGAHLEHDFDCALVAHTSPPSRSRTTAVSRLRASVKGKTATVVAAAPASWAIATSSG